MEYLIAGIRIDIPHRFTTGAFGMALAPFAAENKTEIDAGSNRMAGPVPGTATTAAPSPSETPGTERSAPHPATSPADTAQPDHPAHGTARRRHGRIANLTHSTSPTPMPTAVSAATRRATRLP
ncbi:MAG: hypothetical protein ACLT1W_14180 [Alistipes onderdonkii]